MKLSMLLLLSLIILSCKKDIDSEMNQAVWLKKDQTVKIDGHAILFDTIVEESRCPINARCIWSGRFIAGLKIDGDLISLGTDAPIIDWNGFAIELLEVDPISFSSQKMPSESRYRIQIIVRK